MVFRVIHILIPLNYESIERWLSFYNDRLTTQVSSRSISFTDDGRRAILKTEQVTSERGVTKIDDNGHAATFVVLVDTFIQDVIKNLFPSQE